MSLIGTPKQHADGVRFAAAVKRLEQHISLRRCFATTT
jgi:hypothetical protein